jgi:hypothetical protein
MLRKIILTGLVMVVALLIAVPASAQGRKDAGVIYVTSQGLYFDTIVATDPLPFEGPFQKLEPGPNGLSQTEFGPGDPGYLGGRWCEWQWRNGY